MWPYSGSCLVSHKSSHALSCVLSSLLSYSSMSPSGSLSLDHFPPCFSPSHNSDLSSKFPPQQPSPAAQTASYTPVTLLTTSIGFILLPLEMTVLLYTFTHLVTVFPRRTLSSRGPGTSLVSLHPSAKDTARHTVGAHRLARWMNHLSSDGGMRG